MSAAVLDVGGDTYPISSAGIRAACNPDSCPACGHPEFLHETLLTSLASFVICHEETEYGECYRVRHSEGVPFGACRREPG